MLQRDLSRSDGEEDLPSFGILQQQFATLCERLQEVAKERRFSHWKDASGTVIMRDLFTNPRLYKDVHDYLYLFAHMATKTLCEAVVEGMGGVWDASAEPRRHPNFATGVLEAVVAWSAPQPWHAAAKPFINAALAHRFRNSKRMGK